MGVTNLPEPSFDADDDMFDVLSTNWDSFCAFLDCATQWRILGGLAGLSWLGLDYAGVDVVLRRRGYADKVFADLQLMERAALEVIREAQA